MKKNTLNLFLSLLSFTILLGSHDLLCMKKQPKKDDFDAVMKEQAKRLNLIKLAEDKKKSESLKKQQSDSLKNAEIEKQLLDEHPFIKEFKLNHQNCSLTHKDTLKNYYSWLVTMKNAQLEQDIHLQNMVAYGKHFAELDDITKAFHEAWGPYFVKYPNAGFEIFIPTIHNTTHSIEEIILGLHYREELKSRPEQFMLTAYDYELLNAALQYPKTQWLAHAFLTTGAYYEAERQSVSFCKSIGKPLVSFFEKVNKLPISDNTKKTWFKPLFSMYALIQKNHAISMLHINDDKQFFVDLKQMYTESLIDCQNLIQNMDADLKCLEIKFLPKEKEKQPSLDRSVIPLVPTVELPELSYKKTIVEIQSSKKESDGSINFVKPTSTVPYEKVLDRVNVWYRNPTRALEYLEFKYDKNISQEDYDHIIKCHTFSDFVDYFVEPLAIKCSWKAQHARSGDMSYNIPGQMIDHTTGKETIGVFSYGINQHGVLFHRCFSLRAYEKIENDMKQHIYDGLHPDLSDTTNMQQFTLSPIKLMEECNDSVKQNHFYVEIEDKHNNMTLRLFKVKK